MSGDPRKMFEPGQAGALDFTRFTVTGGDAQQAAADALTLFQDQTALAELHKMVREAGFPECPAEVRPGERYTIATRFAGAPPSADDPKNLDASKAFAVMAMSSAIYQRAQLLEQNADPAHLWHNGILQGQIAMWWRWRSEGHDRRAVSRLVSEAALQESVSGANAERAKTAQERRRLAQGFAAETTLTKGALVAYVQRRFRENGLAEPGRRTVSSYLSK